MDTVDSENIFVGFLGVLKDSFSSPFVGVDGAASEAGSALAELSLRRRYRRLWIRIRSI